MYLHNGIKLGQTAIINNTAYDISWFDQASPSQLSALNVTHVADPTLPDPALYTWTENADGSINAIPIPFETINARIAHAVANNIQTLWQAAHDYEYAELSGVAVGLLVLGVLQSLPKAIAVQQWSKSIWVLYYARKATITDVFDPSTVDFSSIGPIPHSIPELMVELGI